jgi:kynurenine 3-monooxygenase
MQPAFTTPLPLHRRQPSSTSAQSPSQASACATTSASPATAKRRPRSATRTVIAGAGPTGYLAALLLARAGWTDVTLVDRSPDPTASDPSRSFSYLVSGRGRTALRAAGCGIDDELAGKLGAPSSPSRVTVVGADGEANESIIGDAKRNPAGMWIRRHGLLALLARTLKAHYPNVINVLLATEVTGVDFCEQSDEDSSSAPMKVLVKSADSSETVLEASLVLACDGVNSVVRKALCHAEPGVISSAAGFEKEIWTSPSVGVCYKTVQLPASPELGSGEAELQTDPRMMYVLRGDLKRRAPDQAFNMGLLPVGADPSAPRFGTIACASSKAVWKRRTTEESYAFFEENFPQIAHSIRDLISYEEMERFVATETSTFPAIQRSRSLVGHVRTNGSIGAGVALLGDAAHCFPPDLGQGVNCALEDARLLCESLCALGEEFEPLGSSLNRYGENRDPDISALMRLMVIGAPYQYGQSKMMMSLWGLDLALRRNLSDLAPSLFSPHAFSLIGRDHTYSEVLALSDATTTRIWLLFGSIIAVPVVAFLLHGTVYFS